jgi:hypothetical protein
MSRPRQSVTSGGVGEKEDDHGYYGMYEKHHETAFAGGEEAHKRVKQKRKSGEKGTEGRAFRGAVKARVNIWKTIQGNNSKTVEKQADKKERRYENAEYHAHLNPSFHPAREIKCADEREGHVNDSYVDHNYCVVHGAQEQHYAGHKRVDHVERHQPVGRGGA